MLEISKLLLSMYDESQNLSLNEFTKSSFNKIKQLLKFDSAGVCSFTISNAGEFQFKSAYAYKLSAEDKLKSRLDLNLTEKVIPGRGLVGSDPILVKSFNDKNHSHYMDHADIQDKRMAEYANKTEARHTMVMVVDDPKFGGCSSLSLWRAKSGHHYHENDAKLSNIIAPHFFSAIRINKTISTRTNADLTKHLEPIICSLNGFMNFIDNDILSLFKNEWSHWIPPFLPSAILDEIKKNNSMCYIGKIFIAKGHIFQDLLIINIFLKNDNKSLTKSEIRVAWLISEGASYKEIANKLGTSPATVRNQIHSIYLKLNIAKKSSVTTALKNQGYTFSI